MAFDVSAIINPEENQIFDCGSIEPRIYSWELAKWQPKSIIQANTQSYVFSKFSFNIRHPFECNGESRIHLHIRTKSKLEHSSWTISCNSLSIWNGATIKWEAVSKQFQATPMQIYNHASDHMCITICSLSPRYWRDVSRSMNYINSYIVTQIASEFLLECTPHLTYRAHLFLFPFTGQF